MITRLGNQRVIADLLNAGAIGHELPRTIVLPRYERILVLAAHQDDEMIGAGGTFLLAAQAGASFRVVYYSDGATGLGRLDPDDVSQLREHEAARIWQKLAGTDPIYFRYPNRDDAVDPTAPERLAELLRDFEPDAIFLPNFLEQPEDHRKMNALLARAVALLAKRPIVNVYGYQITTRSPGTAAVNITSVWKRKFKLNQLWTTQNALLDYAHLAMGRDIANAYFLKGGRVRKVSASHAEVFLAFPLEQYLTLCSLFYAMPEQTGERFEVQPPDFFVVGMQKSGTYWLTALLDSHPAVRCFPSRPGHGDGSGEAHLFDVLARLEDNEYARFAASMRAKLNGFFADLIPKRSPGTAGERDELIGKIRDRFNAYCTMERTTHRKAIVGEKTTESVHHPDLLDRLYPGVRKVCILRDPRDRAISFHFHQVRKRRREKDQPIDRDTVEAYIERVERDYTGLLSMAEPVHVLTYEDLMIEPEPVVRDLLRFLDVDASDDVVREMLEAASFERLAARSPGEEEISSHYRKGIIGDWKNHLDAELSRLMVDRLEPLTRQVEARFRIDLAGYRQLNEQTQVGASR